MESVLEIIKTVLAEGPAYLTAAMGIITALIGFFMLIKGDQPEKFLQGVLDFIGKFSKK